MTAEIVVMNKYAVALAADSAVTVSSGTGDKKVYNSANKLFALSSTAPVGIMIYGAADFMGLPWETIIKSYRAQKAGAEFDTLDLYYRDFMDYLGDSEDLFPEASRVAATELLLGSYFTFIAHRHQEALAALFASKGSLTENQTKRALSKIVREAEALFDKCEDSVVLGAGSVEPLDTVLGPLIEAAINDALQQTPRYASTDAALRRLGLLLFAKQGPWHDSYSGLVVAGFGATDLTPAYCAVVPRVCLPRRVICTNQQATSVKSGGPTIAAFAQQEMVQTFLEGVDPEYKKATVRYVKLLVEGYPTAILDQLNLPPAIRAPLEAALASSAPDVVKAYTDYLDGMSNTAFSDDIINTVGILPIDELASMAESLVNITSFKRRVTSDPGTVGGPIDVAVISKGDGFIWIRRKHYFDPSLNPQFFMRYQTHPK